MRYHIRAYGKINLVLKVGPRRSDGYHSLFSIYQTVNVWDDLTLTFRKGSRVRVVTDHPALAGKGDNLAQAAARAYFEATGWSAELGIRIEKRIPVGGGMGGGSSNAAAVLMALNRMCPVPVDADKLSGIAAELGSDVPLFLTGGTCIGEGRGERVRALDDAAPFSLVAVMPGVGFPTGRMFELLDQSGERSLEPAAGVDDVLRDPIGCLENDFDAVVADIAPEVYRIMEEMRSEGNTVVLAGSGSTFLVSGMSAEEIRERVPAAWGVRGIVSKPRRMVSHVPSE